MIDETDPFEVCKHAARYNEFGYNCVLVCNNKSRGKTFQLAVVIKYYVSIHNIPRISAMYFIYTSRKENKFSLFLVLLAAY